MAIQHMRFSSSELAFEFKLHLIYGFFIRFFLIAYGVHHDATQLVKFTDIDYEVFSDAASLVARGGSPYDRPTYRYTPFLAWMMLPNVYYSPLFGKLLFALLDCIAAKIIHDILVLEGYSSRIAGRYAFLWLYNPLVIGISARGSSDSLMAALVLMMTYFLKLRLPILTGVTLGFAVHFKIYPVIYALPIYLSFTRNFRNASLFDRVLINKPKIKFGAGMVCAFALMTSLGWILYGDKYIEEGFMYHLKRVDTRHNFSVYFFLLYLCEICNPWVIRICTFLPQFILVFVLGCKYASPSDVNFALFAQTFAFVAYNKVVTSQYFIWYLLLLPLIAPKLDISILKSLVLTVLWVVAQLSWLLPAYLLEFRGIDTFFAIWLEGIAFLCCNVSILVFFIKSYASRKSIIEDAVNRKIR